jgi:hypothetical protein
LLRISLFQHSAFILLVLTDPNGSATKENRMDCDAVVSARHFDGFTAFVPTTQLS